MLGQLQSPLIPVSTVSIPEGGGGGGVGGGYTGLLKQNASKFQNNSYQKILWCFVLVRLWLLSN